MVGIDSGLPSKFDQGNQYPENPIGEKP